MTDPYSILGVGSHADITEVRHAYKALALLYHPDKIGGSLTKFQAIAGAFGILGNTLRREMYDFEHRAVPWKPQARARARARTLFQRNISVIPTLYELLHGGVRDIVVTISQDCTACLGTGAHDPDDFITCLSCCGSGVCDGALPCVSCVSCGGEGGCSVSMRRCNCCNGSRLNNVDACFTVSIPPCPADGVPLNRTHQDLSHSNIHFFLAYPVDVFEARDLVGHTGCMVALVAESNGRFSVSLLIQITLGEMLCGFKRKIEVFGATVVLSHAQYDPAIVEPLRVFKTFRGCLTANDAVGAEGFDVVTYICVLFPDAETVAPFRQLLDRILN